MKITRVKFYQAVSIFNGTKPQLVTHINMANAEISGELELSLLDGIGLLVKTSGESTIITFNNIAFLTGMPEAQAPVKKAAASKN